MISQKVENRKDSDEIKKICDGDIIDVVSESVLSNLGKIFGDSEV